MILPSVIETTIREIRPPTGDWMNRAWERLDSLTKPRRSLGLLEELAARVAGICEADRPRIRSRHVCVFVGDHGVAAEGVSAYPPDVTTLMVKNFLAGGAAVNVLGNWAGAGVTVIDVGMQHRVVHPGLVQRNVRRGTGNLLHGPAMTLDEAVRAVAVGMDVAASRCAEPVSMIGTGEMGIGNTTPAAALHAALLPAPARAVTGAGTGLDRQGLERKIRVVEAALSRNREALDDPLSTLAAVGGLEIAAICGLCLGGAAHRAIVVVDGFISTAGALAAMRLCPAVGNYLFFSHCSAEQGHRRFFDQEGIRPLLDLSMRLGEGTGGVLAMQLIDAAVRIMNEMATFEDMGIQPGA